MIHNRKNINRKKEKKVQLIKDYFKNFEKEINLKKRLGTKKNSKSNTIGKSQRS